MEDVSDVEITNKKYPQISKIGMKTYYIELCW